MFLPTRIEVLLLIIVLVAIIGMAVATGDMTIGIIPAICFLAYLSVAGMLWGWVYWSLVAVTSLWLAGILVKAYLGTGGNTVS